MGGKTGNTSDGTSERPVAGGPAWLAGELQSMILDGKLADGSRLPSSRELSQRYNLGRPAVREALRSLAERNLIDIIPARGVFVRATRPTDTAPQFARLMLLQSATPRHLVEARIMLDGLAAELAAERATPADIAAIAGTLERLDAARGVTAAARLDLEFHSMVARAAHSPVVEAMFGSISTLTLQLMQRSLGDPSISRAGLPYHQQILDAIESRDAAAARAAAVGHLAVGERHYGTDFDRPLTELVDADEVG
jgi:DNA-binding FadR family transcriptional regulator